MTGNGFSVLRGTAKVLLFYIPFWGLPYPVHHCSFPIFAKVYINNDIQAKIFARVIDAKWSDIAKYPTGDLLTRFNSDVSTIAANAVNWIPSIINAEKEDVVRDFAIK